MVLAVWFVAYSCEENVLKLKTLADQLCWRNQLISTAETWWAILKSIAEMCCWYPLLKIIDTFYLKVVRAVVSLLHTFYNCLKVENNRHVLVENVLVSLPCSALVLMFPFMLSSFSRRRQHQDYLSFTFCLDVMMVTISKTLHKRKPGINC